MARFEGFFEFPGKFAGPLIVFLWSVVVLSIFTNMFSPFAAIWLFENPSRLLATIILFVVLSVVSVLIFIGWQKNSRKQEFDLYCATEHLKPEDVGFKVVAAGEQSPDTRRPYVLHAYLRRTAIPYAERHRAAPSPIYEEEDMVALLEAGQSLLLVGQPTEGKTRTLFEIVRHLKGYVVVRPKHNENPSSEALQLLKGKYVVCLLDDLNHFAGTLVDLLAFYRRAIPIAAKFVLAATCREGPELAELDHLTTPLGRIYESFQYRLWLQRASDEQKSTLKRLLGHTDTRVFPTLGAICMREVFEIMRRRFAALTPEARDSFRALQLLTYGGVEPLSCCRLERVLKHVFERRLSGATLRDCLIELEKSGFLLSTGSAEPILADAAYLTGPEATYYYRSDRTCEDDLTALGECLFGLGDASGLNSLALSYHRLRNQRSAVALWEGVAAQFLDSQDSSLREEAAKAIFNRGVVLAEQNMLNEAIVCNDQVVEYFGAEKRAGIRELVAMALFNKGVALEHQDRLDDAIASYTEIVSRFNADEDARVREQVAKALYNNAVALMQQGKRDDEIACWTEIVVRFDANKEPWLRWLVAMAYYNKGGALNLQNKLDDEIACYEEFLDRLDGSKDSAIRRLMATALVNKGAALGQQNKLDGEIVCYEEVVRLFGADREAEVSDVVETALRNKSIAIAMKGSIAIRGKSIIKPGLRVLDFHRSRGKSVRD